MSPSLVFTNRTGQAAPPAAGDDVRSTSGGGDPLLAFPTEREKASAQSPASAEALPSVPPARHPSLTQAVAGIILASATIVGVGYYLTTRPRPTPAGSVATGTATITSRPEGLEVAVGGVVRGTTPIRLSLAPGEHLVEIGSGTARRSLPITIEAGALVSQYVELAPAAEPAPSTGRLEITSDPAGAQVRIDGAPRGTTPLTVTDIAAGEHAVVISSGATVITRRVSVAPGATASIFASAAAAGAAAGWVTFDAPIDLEVHEGGRLVGTTATDRLMLPVGRHDLQLVNTALEFRRSVTVQVTAGSTSTTTVAVPDGSLSINALPWADIWIDGRAVGTTPLGNLAVPIGSHEIVWRHPELGERRRTVDVTASTPVRLGMDFSQ